MLARIIAERLPQMRLQLDLLHRDIARHLPLAIHGAPLSESMHPRELVLEETGRIVPLTYGPPIRFEVTNNQQKPISAAWQGYLESTWNALRRRLRIACVEVARGRHGEVVAWHEVVRQRAEAHLNGVQGFAADIVAA